MAKFSSNSSNTSSYFFIDEGSDAIEYLAGGSVDLSCEATKTMNAKSKMTRTTTSAKTRNATTETTS